VSSDESRTPSKTRHFCVRVFVLVRLPQGSGKVPHQTYLVYLDEFGHIGPFVSRTDPKYNTFPVFGFGGIIMPAEQVRFFSSWFFKLKCNLLSFEVGRSKTPAHSWEKKGSALYTTKNVVKYPELRRATFRLFDQIERCGGHIFYVGVEKFSDVAKHSPNDLTFAVLREAIKRLDSHCVKDIAGDAGYLMFLDRREEQTYRDSLITVTQQEMYGESSRRTLLEAPTQVESHRYQVMQAADWICALIGRIETYHTRQQEYPDYDWTDKYFTSRLKRIAIRSGVRKEAKLLEGQDAHL
jgi:hypothetical protein